MDVWLNGRFVARDDARVSVFDAGFQHAVGLFETLLARNGRVFRPHRHLEQLAASAKALSLTERLRVGPLIEAVEAVVAHNNLEAARIRITITGGDLNMLQAEGQTQNDPTILIVAQPPTPYPEELFTNGVVIGVSAARLNPFTPFAGAKTLGYWERIRELQVVAARGGGEALWLSVTNHVACGCVSNVFLVVDDVLLTPPAFGEEGEDEVPMPVRPGVTRATIMELAERRGITVERRPVMPDEVLKADEVFLTNASWGVLPVTGIEQETIGDGTPGSLTMDMRADWMALVEAETTVETDA